MGNYLEPVCRCPCEHLLHCVQARRKQAFLSPLIRLNILRASQSWLHLTGKSSFSKCGAAWASDCTGRIGHKHSFYNAWLWCFLKIKERHRTNKQIKWACIWSWPGCRQSWNGSGAHFLSSSLFTSWDGLEDQMKWSVSRFLSCNRKEHFIASSVSSEISLREP